MSERPMVEGGFCPADQDDVPIEAIRQFLDHEAEILDDPRRIREWCRLLTDDFVYDVPVRVTRDSQSKDPRFPNGSLHIHESKATIERRAQRLEGGHAWGEEPPSLVRRMIGGVRAARAGADELRVRSAFLLYHSRHRVEGDLVAGERHDVVRVQERRLFLARRTVHLDHVVIPTQNIVFFL